MEADRNDGVPVVEDDSFSSDKPDSDDDEETETPLPAPTIFYSDESTEPFFIEAPVRVDTPPLDAYYPNFDPALQGLDEHDRLLAMRRRLLSPEPSNDSDSNAHGEEVYAGPALREDPEPMENQQERVMDPIPFDENANDVKDEAPDAEESQNSQQLPDQSELVGSPKVSSSIVVPKIEKTDDYPFLPSDEAGSGVVLCDSSPDEPPKAASAGDDCESSLRVSSTDAVQDLESPGRPHILSSNEVQCDSSAEVALGMAPDCSKQNAISSNDLLSGMEVCDSFPVVAVDTSPKGEAQKSNDIEDSLNIEGIVPNILLPSSANIGPEVENKSGREEIVVLCEAQSLSSPSHNEKAAVSKSQKSKESDSRKHHSHSHSRKSSSKSESHHSRSSHSHRSSRDRGRDRDRNRERERDRDRDCSGKSHPSRSRHRFYNVRIQTDHENIIHEVRDKSGKYERPKTTRIPWSPHPRLTSYKYRKYFRIETDPNGGADVCHMYWDEICHLSSDLRAEVALQFVKLTYSEDDDECAYHVIGIVHDAGEYLPDLVDYMADHYGGITVKTGSLTGRGTQSLTMAKYRDELYKTYAKGTFRYPPLQEISICGVQGEEVGAYFPDFVRRLEESPCMKAVMPWSIHSVVHTDNPRESNDGPIFWVRPGEQTLPSCEGARSKGRIAKGVSRLSEAREALFEDRTKPHADQIGIDGVTADTAPTAAVGVLKAVVCGNKAESFRATKDVIAFHARDYNALVDLLQIDVYEPPLKQCPMWLETAKLNSLRRQGIRYAHIQLNGNDVYYLPRKIIHQFQTTSAVASVAWHVRWRDYFLKTGAPNLHTPTGLNKGAVYYEKKDVPIYEPPVPDDLSDEEVYVPTPSRRSISRTPRSRTKKYISEGNVTPTSIKDESSSHVKVRKLDIDGFGTRLEPQPDSTDVSPSKKRSRRHSGSIAIASTSGMWTPSIASCSSSAAPLSSTSKSDSSKEKESVTSSLYSASSTTSNERQKDKTIKACFASSSGSTKKGGHSKDAEKISPDRRRSADDVALKRPSERRSSLESHSVSTPEKVQPDQDQKRSAENVPTPPKTEKPLRENILAKKRRKVVAEEKAVSYDVLGDIMQQMDKSKTF